MTPTEELDEFFDVFANDPAHRDSPPVWIGAVPEESILQLEELLGFRLPEAYRAFIAKVGGSVNDNGFWGINPELPLEEGGSTFRLTKWLQEEEGLPADCLVIEYDDDLDFSHTLVLDCRDHSNPDPMVRNYRAEFGDFDLDFCHESFVSLLYFWFGLQRPGVPSIEPTRPAWKDLSIKTFNLTAERTPQQQNQIGDRDYDAPPLQAPFDADTAARSQQVFATELGRQVRAACANGITTVVIPSGTFVMGNSVNYQEFARVFPKSDEDYYDCASPAHLVTLSRPFELGERTVTVGQFKAFTDATGYKTWAEKTDRIINGLAPATKNDPSRNINGVHYQWKKNFYSWRRPGFDVPQVDSAPVVFISWIDAIAFCNWMSKQAGREPYYQVQSVEAINTQRRFHEATPSHATTIGGNGYRLPTEAEWEFACRAGTQTLYSFGDDPKYLVRYGEAKVIAKAGAPRENRPLTKHGLIEGPAPADGFQPNPFGLLAMHGGVWEWCHDWFSPTYYRTSPTLDPDGAPRSKERSLRGGCWNSLPAVCVASLRHGNDPAHASDSYGFRIAATLG